MEEKRGGKTWRKNEMIKFYERVGNDYIEIDLPINLDLWDDYYYGWS